MMTMHEEASGIQTDLLSGKSDTNGNYSYQWSCIFPKKSHVASQLTSVVPNHFHSAAQGPVDPPSFHMPCKPGSKPTNDGSTPKRYPHKLWHGGATGDNWKQAHLQGNQSKTVTFNSPNSQKDTSSPIVTNSISHIFPSDTITTESASTTFYTCRAHLTVGLSPSESSPTHSK